MGLGHEATFAGLDSAHIHMIQDDFSNFGYGSGTGRLLRISGLKAA